MGEARSRRWRGDAPLAAIVLIAGLNFSWTLGSSSLFIDEVYSIQDAIAPVSGVLTHVRTIEVTPWTYFLFLHEWIGRTGSRAEWVARLPSALAGIALVAAVYWMARAFLERRGALLAAALCALSPLVLEYAQEVRVYALLMLCLTLAVGLTVRGAHPDAPARSRTRLLAIGAGAAILSIWLHYPAAFVVFPLCVWLAVQDSISVRARVAFIASCAIASLPLAPLLLDQIHRNGGLGSAAGVNWGSLLELAETPFDTRAQSEFDPRVLGVGALDVIAVVVGLVSLVLVLSRRRAPVRDRRLLVSLALCAPALLVLAGLAGSDVVNKRYAAVAAPFMLTVIAAAATRLRAAGAVLATTALVVCLIGSLDTHRRAGFYYPARDAIGYVEESWTPGDVIVAPTELSAFVPLSYYAQQRMRPPPEVIAPSGWQPLLPLLRAHKRVWLIAKLPVNPVRNAQLLAIVDREFKPYRYHAVTARTFTTVATFAVVLVTPAP